MTFPLAKHRAIPLRPSVALVALVLCGAIALPVQAQPKAAAADPSLRQASKPGSEQGPSWSTLKPAQREALKPLEREWPGIDSLRKRKWIEIAERYPSLSPQDQARLQTRMTEWTRLTPVERGQVRLNYQEAKQTPAQDRQASWEAYQSLPPEQRRELANRAAPAAASAGRPGPAGAGSASTAAVDTRVRAEAQRKSNTVPDTTLAAPPQSVAPTVLQNRPGATTTLITKPPAPPAHQQTGMPKIAATPEFVDTKTLLPQAGAQSTAPRADAASAPPTRP